MKTYYHVSLKKNINDILNKGLLPKIGERSKEIKENIKRVYLFTTKDDMENALMNWLGEWYTDRYGDEVKLISLKVEVPNNFPILESTVDYEKVCEVIIPPKYIKYLQDE